MFIFAVNIRHFFSITATMKRFYFIGVFMILAVTACHTPTREAKRLVKVAGQLAVTLPDSTVSLIDSVLRMPVNFSERERMDMALLQAEALFGRRGAASNVSDISPVMDDDFFDDRKVVSTSPELEHAADYYAKKKQYGNAAHAALYSGFVQQHYNEMETAMRSFKAAEQYGKLAEDSLTVAQAQFRMGKMLLDDGREQDAIALLQAANVGFGNCYVEKALAMNMLGVCYILQNDFATAEECLHQSLLYIEESPQKANKVNHKILNNFAVLYRIQREYDQALTSLQQLEGDSSLDDTERLMLCLNHGRVYSDMKEVDSAAKYFQRLEAILPNVNVKKETRASVYEALSNFSETQNSFALALQYRELHERVLYEIMTQRQEQTIYRIQQQYDYERLKNEMNLERAHIQRIIVSGIGMLLCVLAYFLYRSSQRNKKMAEVNAELFHFMQQNKTLVESNMEREKKVLDTTQQLSEMLRSRFNTMQKLDYSMKNPRDKIALKDLEKEVFGDREHWDAVKEILTAMYPGLWESLSLKYPEMDEMERRVFLLSRFKLSRVEEAALLNISTSVLDKLRTKVRKIVEQSNKQ